MKTTEIIEKLKKRIYRLRAKLVSPDFDKTLTYGYDKAINELELAIKDISQYNLLEPIKTKLMRLREPYATQALTNATNLEFKVETTADAVWQAFVWRNTAEGVDYWDDVYQSLLTKKEVDKNSQSLLNNTLLTDNASEALYEVIGEGTNKFSMLVCEALDKDGNKYQLHIVAVSNDDDFIENSEEMPVFAINDEYQLILP